jgi:hypothetical protein
LDRYFCNPRRAAAEFGNVTRASSASFPVTARSGFPRLTARREAPLSKE